MTTLKNQNKRTRCGLLFHKQHLGSGAEWRKGSVRQSYALIPKETGFEAAIYLSLHIDTYFIWSSYVVELFQIQFFQQGPCCDLDFPFAVKQGKILGGFYKKLQIFDKKHILSFHFGRFQMMKMEHFLRFEKFHQCEKSENTKN